MKFWDWLNEPRMSYAQFFGAVLGISFAWAVLR